MSMNTHIRGMPRSTPSSATPDLFSYVPPTPVLGARRTPAQVKSAVAEPSRLSNGRLTQLLRELTSELQRWKPSGLGRASQSELDQAIQDAACALESLVPRRFQRNAPYRRWPQCAPQQPCGSSTLPASGCPHVSSGLDPAMSPLLTRDISSARLFLARLTRLFTVPTAQPSA
jgi:hypothetical protein